MSPPPRSPLPPTVDDVQAQLKQQEQLAQHTITHYMTELAKSQAHVRQLQSLVDHQEALILALTKQQELQAQALQAVPPPALSQDPPTIESLGRAKEDLAASIDTLGANINLHQANMAMIMMISTETQDYVEHHRALTQRHIHLLQDELSRRDALLAQYGLTNSVSTEDMLSLPSLASIKHASSSSSSSTTSSITTPSHHPSTFSPPSSPHHPPPHLQHLPPSALSAYPPP
ncbi:hypothetical protein DM01DRAFT_1340883, partial [Hesseltinella vesiculosa]